METRKGNSGPVAQLYLAAQAVDSANIVAGASVETSISFPGVAVGDILEGQPRSALAAGIVKNTIRVTAADTIGLTLTNITAGAIDPASNVWDFVANRP